MTYKASLLNFRTTQDSVARRSGPEPGIQRSGHSSYRGEKGPAAGECGPG